MVWSLMSVLSTLSWGGCPTYSPVDNFDLEAYMGKWYEIYRYPAPFEAGCTCVTANYTLSTNDKGEPYVQVDNSCLKNGEFTQSLGKATQPKDGVGAFVVTFSDAQKLFTWSPNYNVLDVTYDEYSLVYSCTSFGIAKWELAWILARQPTLDESKVEELKQKLKQIGSKTELFEKTVQDTC